MRWLPLIALMGTLLGCSADEEPAQTCVEGGKSHRAGESWLCSDACNRCTCYPDGSYTMTGKACDGAVTDAAHETLASSSPINECEWAYMGSRFVSCKRGEACALDVGPGSPDAVYKVLYCAPTDQAPNCGDLYCPAGWSCTDKTLGRCVGELSP